MEEDLEHCCCVSYLGDLENWEEKHYYPERKLCYAEYRNSRIFEYIWGNPERQRPEFGGMEKIPERAQTM